MGVMDLFSLGAAGDLGPDAQCIADWVLQSFNLTCRANEWKPQTGAPATHEESNWQTWYSTDGYPASPAACSPGVDHHSPSGMVHSPTGVLPASGINEGNFASVPHSLAEALRPSSYGDGTSWSATQPMAETSAQYSAPTDDAVKPTDSPEAPGTFRDVATLCAASCGGAIGMPPSARFFAGEQAPTAPMRRFTDPKELQVNAFNRRFPAPVVTYIDSKTWRCEYCSDLGNKPVIRAFHALGRGNPVDLHHKLDKNHKGKDTEIKAWCESRNRHVIRPSPDSLGQATLARFFQPAAATEPLLATKQSDTFLGRVTQLKQRPQRATTLEQNAINAIVCNGFEPSHMRIRHNGRNLFVNIDELRLDDFSAAEIAGRESFVVDPQWNFERKDGAVVRGALRSTNCRKALCTNCVNLDKNKRFQDRVRA